MKGYKPYGARIRGSRVVVHLNGGVDAVALPANSQRIGLIFSGTSNFGLKFGESLASTTDGFQWRQNSTAFELRDESIGEMIHSEVHVFGSGILTVSFIEVIGECGCRGRDE